MQYSRSIFIFQTQVEQHMNYYLYILKNLEVVKMLKLQGLDMINVNDVLATMDNNNSQMWLDIMRNGDSKINQYMKYVAQEN